ncbi:hypothetical protein JQ604_20725 [Bradyrhizobium jicamae]|uniref:hypothetical protein n=1 Tax=Bradyrhizobium jicamae TaxID=280332 RepID=UPI001BACE392|nr:hypothetical protein [Bradyrhizobium jicamae]MBR0754617.1 hypothetical protein [Bradyrhizobium jicamae]
MRPVYLGAFVVACAVIYFFTMRPSTNGAVYRVPLAQVRQDLAKADIPPVFGSTPLDVQARGIGDAVVWTVRQGREEIFRYTADLKVEGDGATRVKVKMEGTGAYAKRLADKPLIRDMYLIAMEERVASTLEHREYDMTRVYPAMSAAVVSNMGNLQASADQAAAASERENRRNYEKAYRDEAAGRR